MRYFLLFLGLAMAVTIGSLAIAQPLDKPPPLEDLAIVPIRTPPPVAFDANAGSYTRSIVEPKTIYDAFSAGKPTFSGVQPFQGRDSVSPSFDGQYSVGQGEGGRFTGGGVAEWKDVIRRGPTLLIIMGGLMLAAGIIVAVWAGRWVLGLAVAGAGLAMAMTGVLFEMYPWVVLIALAGVLGVGIWWLIDSKGLLKTKTALIAVVGAIEANPTVKAAVGDAAAALNAESDIRTTIRKAKASTAAKTAEKAASDAARLKAATTG
ncbi:MAG TPA: hypothetical protein VMY35_20030 [Phycisphaerae bacterium]|nr:hypothetical protein [Phycisphaerae bacterium]